MTIFHEYPIVHSFEALCSGIALIPPLILFLVVRNSTLHPNCTLLIALWTAAQILLNVSTLSYAFYFTFVHYETLPGSHYEHPVRVFFVENNIRLWYICSCFELGISVERGELTNLYVFAKSRRRNNTLDSLSTLNGRYQVRESYTVSRAMMPVYFYIFILKILLVMTNWAFVLDLIPFAVGEIIGLTLFSSCTAIMSSSFLVCNESLKKRAVVLLLRRGHRAGQDLSLPDPSTSVQAADAHFQLLTTMWK